jgi:hypothetical protein
VKVHEQIRTTDAHPRSERDHRWYWRNLKSQLGYVHVHVEPYLVSSLVLFRTRTRTRTIKR